MLAPRASTPAALDGSSDRSGKSQGGLFCSWLAVLEMLSMALEMMLSMALKVEDGKRIAIS